MKILLILITICFVNPIRITYAEPLDSLKPAGWVSDFASVLDPVSSQRINGLINEIEKKTSAEIAVVTVRNLEGDSVEDYAVRLFEKWGIGKKGKDNGILLLAATEDKKVKIEVGYGLEGIIPDGLAGEILDKYVIPYFRQNDYSRGLLLGTFAIVAIIAKDANVEISGLTATPIASETQKPGLFSLLLRFLLFIILALVFIRLPFLFLLFLGMSGGRGRGFGGGGFSGGFGGFGGGRSGGGGGSRSW